VSVEFVHVYTEEDYCSCTCNGVWVPREISWKYSWNKDNLIFVVCESLLTFLFQGLRRSVNAPNGKHIVVTLSVRLSVRLSVQYLVRQITLKLLVVLI